MSSQCGRTALPNVLSHVARLSSKDPVCRSHYLTSLRKHEGQITIYSLVCSHQSPTDRHDIVCLQQWLPLSPTNMSSASVTALLCHPTPCTE